MAGPLTDEARDGLEHPLPCETTVQELGVGVIPATQGRMRPRVIRATPAQPGGVKGARPTPERDGDRIPRRPAWVSGTSRRIAGRGQRSLDNARRFRQDLRVCASPFI